MDVCLTPRLRVYDFSRLALGLYVYRRSICSQYSGYHAYTKNHPPFVVTTVPVTLWSFIRYRFASATSSGPGTFPVGSLAALEESMVSDCFDLEETDPDQGHRGYCSPAQGHCKIINLQHRRAILSFSHPKRQNSPRTQYRPHPVKRD